MAAESGKCPLCDKNASVSSYNSAYDSVACPRCGEFLATDDLIDFLPGMKGIFGQRYILSGMTRWNTERKLRPISLMTSNVEGFISDYSALGVSDKACKLLEYVKLKSRFPGDEVRISLGTDYPVAFCNNVGEFSYYLKFLRESRLVSQLADQPLLTITPEGWAWLDEHNRTNVDSSKVFVAMWFDESLRPAYDEGIEPAVTSAGYDSVRIDLKEDVNKIDDEIIAEIRRSRFLVVDVTGHRPSVYFEAGFAIGLGIPVIWLCRKGSDELHFDLKRQALEERISLAALLVKALREYLKDQRRTRENVESK